MITKFAEDAETTVVAEESVKYLPDGTMQADTNIFQMLKQVKARFSPPEGEGLIWWLIRVQQHPLKQALAAIGFFFLFQVAGFNWIGALVMLFSMAFHEAGHALFFWLGKIDFKLLLLFPLGAVAAPANKEQNEKSDQLPWFFLSFLLFAGPAANAILMIAGIILKTVAADPTLIAFGQMSVYVNALLGIMNMIPVWKLDAGQYAKLVFSSMTEKWDRIFAAMVTFVIFGVVAILLMYSSLTSGEVFDIRLVLLSLLNNFSAVAFSLLAFICVIYVQGTDDPKHSESPLRMNSRQIAITVMCYTALTVFLLFLAVR